ncbi:MAG: hypothetical protein COS92_04125 [Desulfobacterales bacterium CG07_land_8_20_14_0_80_52_14]|nr:MAG: hypothetical protein COS92_04125 [Desulfobacterales bacterium CG07_land_8_20_14_0_80_52_14]
MCPIDATLSDDERYDEWKRIIELIRKEHVGLDWAHYVFRLFREVFNANESLRQCGGFLLDTIAVMYITHVLMGFRRDMDIQGGTENLINLLYDMKKHANQMTRRRFLSSYGDTDETLTRIQNDRFDEWSPLIGHYGPDTDHIDPKRIQADIKKLKNAVENVRLYAERIISHRTPHDTRLTLSFGEMHSAIHELRKIINWYYLFLTGGSMGNWEPIPQYDTLKLFFIPWLPDDPTIIKAVREAIEK